MVKIRYSELPAGLHVEAAADRDGTVVYLQPGLTPAQRRAALIRVRSSARIGQGPTLPRPAMARALAADRVRTTARIGGAATRRHPMLFLPPVIVVIVSAIAFVFMTVQPLTIPNQGNVGAAVPTLAAGAAALQTWPSPAHSVPPQQQPTAPSRTQHRHVQMAFTPPACTTLQTWASRWRLPAPPWHAGPALTRCHRRYERWLRTYHP